MGRNTTKGQQARATARQRQADLAKTRAAHDRRVVDLTTAVLVAIGGVDDARQRVADAEGRLGHAIRALLAEDVPIGDAVTLTGLGAAEISRLRRLCTGEPPGGVCAERTGGQ